MNPIIENLTPEEARDLDRRAAWLWAYCSEERVIWMQQQHSVVSGKYPCVNAHTRAGRPEYRGGTSYKAAYQTIVPLTWAEHEELGSIGQDSFGLTYGVDLTALAAEINERWERYLVSPQRVRLPW